MNFFFYLFSYEINNIQVKIKIIETKIFFFIINENLYNIYIEKHWLVLNES